MNLVIDVFEKIRDKSETTRRYISLSAMLVSNFIIYLQQFCTNMLQFITYSATAKKLNHTLNSMSNLDKFQIPQKTYNFSIYQHLFTSDRVERNNMKKKA